MTMTRVRVGFGVAALVLASCGNDGSVTSSTSTSGKVSTSSSTTAAAITTMPAGSTTMVPSTTSAPAAGTLDSSFGKDGLTIVPLTSSGSAVSAVAEAVAVDADGRIVVAGEADVAEQPNVALTRLLANGSPDESFGERGSLILDQPGDANGVLPLSGGGMVITGTSLDSNSGSAQLLLARLLEDGSPDVTFGTDGRTTVGCDVGQCSPMPPVRQSGGRIVIVATDVINEQPFEGTIAVFGFDGEGRLDPSFGSSGIARLGAGSASAVALDASERVVIVGAVSDRNFIARLDPDGALDTSFGTDGVITFPKVQETGSGTPLSSSPGTASSSPVDAAKVTSATGSHLTRFDDRGRLDTSYGTAGIVEIALKRECRTPQRS